MEMEHQIDDEVLAIIKFAIEQHHHWIVYNMVSYFLGKEDVFFFKEKEEADEFCANNISEFDVYTAIQAASVEEAIQQIATGETQDYTQDRKERTRGDMDDLDMGRGKGNRL